MFHIFQYRVYIADSCNIQHISGHGKVTRREATAGEPAMMFDPAPEEIEVPFRRVVVPVVASPGMKRG